MLQVKTIIIKDKLAKIIHWQKRYVEMYPIS